MDHQEVMPNQVHHFETMGKYVLDDSDDEDDFEVCRKVGLTDEQIEELVKQVALWKEDGTLRPSQWWCVKEWMLEEVNKYLRTCKNVVNTYYIHLVDDKVLLESIIWECV